MQYSTKEKWGNAYDDGRVQGTYFLLVQSSYDIDYIIAVYSFAVSYPDKTREA